MILADEEVEQFVEAGHTVLRQAFERDVAAQGRAFVAQRIGQSERGLVSRWRGVVHVRELFSGPPFDRVMTERLRGALEQLTGPGRLRIHERLGWWPVLLPGFRALGGWHVDGHDFQHCLTSPEQALVAILLFSDVSRGDGGTAVVPGSHRAVARVLAAAGPRGLTAGQLRLRVPRPGRAGAIELTGAAGDVLLLHPFLVHRSSSNRGRVARFACNPRWALREPMQLDRPDGAHSPVEEAIRRTLGKTAEGRSLRWTS